MKIARVTQDGQLIGTKKVERYNHESARAAVESFDDGKSSIEIQGENMEYMAFFDNGTVWDVEIN